MVQNSFDGTAHNVVQAGQIYGGIHYHARTMGPPPWVPAPTPHFTNQRPVLAKVDAAAGGEGQRIVVVTGPPGSGKREVVRYWLQQHEQDFPDGQFHADLSAGVGETGKESAVLRDFLLAANFDPAAIPDTAEGRAERFRNWSKDKRVAVSVDRALTPSQVRMLLPGGPSLVLVTAAGQLEGLAADKTVTFLDLEPLEDSAAEELLGRVAGRDRLAAEPAATRQLVDACGGLPIALCAVGAMVAARSGRRMARLVADIADERRRLAALSSAGGLSVTAVFNTAYERLGELARTCYLASGVHPGSAGFTAATVAAGLGMAEHAVLDGLDELVTARLLREEGDDRYRTYPLLAEHAAALAADQPHTAAIRAATVDHYLHTAVAAGDAVMPQRGWLAAFFPDRRLVPAPDAPLAWLAAERENLRTVADVLAVDRPMDLCLLAVALWPLHERGKHLDDLRAVNEAALAALDPAEHPQVAALLQIQLGFGLMHGGAHDAAYRAFTAAQQTADGMPALRATAVESRGIAKFRAGDRAAAAELLRHNLSLAEALGEPRRLALARMHLARATEETALLQSAVAGFLALDPADVYNAAKARVWIGRIHQDPVVAAAALDAAEPVLRDHPFDLAQLFEARAVLVGAQEAEQLRAAALAIYQDGGFLSDVDRLTASSR